MDECSIENGGCEHICVNKPGAYECICNPGYSVQSDNKSCSGNASVMTNDSE